MAGNVSALWQLCSTLTGIELGGIIAIRNGKGHGKVIKENTVVEDGDEIDIFPAIFGG